MDRGQATKVISYDRDLQNISEFLHMWKPSCVMFEQVEWLTVSSEHSSEVSSLVDTLGLAAAWESLCLFSHDQLTTSHIESLTKTHNVLHGKWMIFATTDKVDKVWETIAYAVVKDGLALDAKVSTLHVKPEKSGLPKEEKIPPGKHVICVWSKNFSDIEDVFALRTRLGELGFKGPLGYKPDAYSICAVYHGNSLGLPAVKFRS